MSADTIADQLADASAAVRQARDKVADLYGCGDDLFDRLTDAQETIDDAADRLANETQE